MTTADTVDIEIPNTTEGVLELLDRLQAADAAAVRFYAGLIERGVPKGKTARECLTADEIDAVAEDAGFDAEAARLHAWSKAHKIDLFTWLHDVLVADSDDPDGLSLGQQSPH